MPVKTKSKKTEISGSVILNALMEYIPDSIFFKDLKSRFIRINKACADKFGIKNTGEVKNKTDFDFFSEEHAKQAYEDEQNIIKTGKPIMGFEEKETFEDKADKWTYTTKMPLYNKKGKIIGTFGITRDITDKKKAEEKIWYLSCHDKLTDLYNRAYFEEELKRLDTRRQLPLSIIFCDVDGLKVLNDNYGYDKGDQLLCRVADILRCSFRDEDIVARWGGDEFIIVLPNTREKIVDDIIDRICEDCKLENEFSFPISVSFGKAIKNKKSQDIDLIISKAEKSMSMNKRAMKAGVQA